jgi:hypothetical protein
MRLLGDEYIKSEFRAHRVVENPVHIVISPRNRTTEPGLANPPQIGFLTEWQMYAQKLEGDSWIGDRMDIGKIDKMSGMILEIHTQYQRLTPWKISSWVNCMNLCRRYGRSNWKTVSLASNYMKFGFVGRLCRSMQLLSLYLGYEY